jgi:hypothetical protein
VFAARAPYIRQTSLPAATTSLPLGLAGALALAVAILAATGAVALASADLRRRRAKRPRPGWNGTRLELVLRYLRDSAARSAEDRRRAADFAARAVEGPLADEATRVAWAAPLPVAGDVTKLAEDVERAGASA